MGLGTEILFMLMLGLLVLGPKQLHTLSRHVARAKAQFEQASRSLKSQLATEFDATHQEGRLMPRMNWWGRRRTILGSSLAEQRTHRVRVAHAAGHQGDRIRKIFLSRDIDDRHFYFEGTLNHRKL